jgi:hypothetical protein
MKKILILIIAFGTLSFIFAQNNSPIKLTMSEEFANNNDNRTTVEKILRDKKGNIIVIKNITRLFNSNQTYIEAYTPKLKLIYAQELVVDGVGGKELNYIGAYTIGNEPYIITSFYNKQKDFRYLLTSKIGEDGRLAKPVKISEYPTTSSQEGSFELVFSKDSSKVLVVNKLPSKRQESEQFSFVVLDQDLKEIWKAKASLPYENRHVVLSDYAVDNDANVFVLATVDIRGSDEVIQEIFEYQNGASGSKRFKTNLKDKIINKLRILPDNKGDIVCVGQYSSLKEKDNIFRRFRSTTLGTIFFKINGEKNEIIEKSINPFDEKTFAYFEVKKSRQDKGYGIENLSLWNVWVSTDNSIFIDFEMEYFVVSSDNSGRFGAARTTRTTYYSTSGLLVRLSPDGKVLYETTVPKAISSTNDKTGLYHVVTHKDNSVFYVYNDNLTNMERKITTIDDVRFAYSPEGSSWVLGDRKPAVICCIIDEYGIRKFAKLFSFKEDDVFLNTENSLQYDKNTFIVIASYFRNYKLVKMEF